MFKVNQLVGFGGSRSLKSITQQGSASSQLSTVTAPAGIQAGDLLALLDIALDGSSPTTVVPTGFTSINNVNANDGTTFIRQILSYKKAIGTEGGSTITGMTGSFGTAKAIYVFRGNIPATVITPSTPNGQATSGTPTNQSVTASSGVSPLVVLGGYGSSGSIATRGFSPAKDGEINPNSFFYLAYKIYNSSPLDTTISMADAGVNAMQSVYVSMS